jgi:hypothetical protein
MRDRTLERRGAERGFALVTVMMLAALVAALVAAHFVLTRIDLSTTRSSMSATRGFYAAEAGLNIRAEQIRDTFLGYGLPAGEPPAELPGTLPCRGGSLGSGDFECKSYAFRDREVLTFVDDDLDDDGAPDPATTITIPPDEPYQGLSAQEYTYGVSSVAVGDRGRPEAILDMHFKSRLVPLFQFAVFYNKDLEILPGPPMTLAGPVHANGNLFLQSDAGGSLAIDGQVTLSGRLFHGRKNDGSCNTGSVAVHDLSGPLSVPACAGPEIEELVTADVDGTNPPHRDWQGMIRIGVPAVDVPRPDALDPVPGRIFWDKADLRVLRDLTDPLQPVKVYGPDGTADAIRTLLLGLECGAAVGTSESFYNHREATAIRMLEVDLQALLDCVEDTPLLMDGKRLDDATQGGLVWYFGVDDGVNAAAPDAYGVRVRRGATLLPTSRATNVRGLTIVTNQAAYVQGDFNRDDGPDWRPAAFLADSINVLSNAWDDASSSRRAADTTIRAAFLAGTDTTGGGAEQEGALDTGGYNGGLENYPRLHEDWDEVTLTYRGSFVSLNRPLRVRGPWSAQVYVPPDRDWGYETRFNDPAKLPPLTPRFVYLRQALFVRSFEY